VGCGCGKRRASRNSRRSVDKVRKMVQRPSLSSEIMSLRKNKCKKCGFSTRVKDRSSKKVLKCKKANRLVGAIIRDERFKCPIGKF
jgi:predicted Zn-ribbon and HTH transcriptional regulator